MRDLNVEASWPPGACCCGGGASKETRRRNRCWARSPGDAKAMSGGLLIVGCSCGQLFTGQPEACGCRGYARRALGESRRLRDGAQPSSCPVPYSVTANRLSHRAGRADAEYHGPLEASVNATRRPPRLETTTFGWGEKNVTAAQRHGDIAGDKSGDMLLS